MRIRSRKPEDTRAAGAALGRAARAVAGRVPGGVLPVVWLLGGLGAGKTTFAKGVAAGLGLDPQRVASPTFVIASEYPLPAEPGGAGGGGGLRRLVHADLYRLEHPEELEAAGLRDWLAPGTLLLVEWADRLPGALPEAGLRVALRDAGDAPGAGPGGVAGDRVLEIEARGAAAEAVLEAWRARWR